MTTIMSSNRPPKKPPPPDPQRSGKPVPKGKGRAKAPTPEIENQAEEVWQGVTFSEDEAPAYEGKKKRKQRLAEEAAEEYSRETADDHAKKEVWATASRADPSTEELNRFLSYRDDMNMVRRTAKASRRPRPVSQPRSGAQAPSNSCTRPTTKGILWAPRQRCRSGAEAPLHLGAPASPAPPVMGAETPLRPGHHPADTVNPPPMRKIGSSERRSSVCATTGAKTK
jgi:hypothetical protein